MAVFGAALWIWCVCGHSATTTFERRVGRMFIVRVMAAVQGDSLSEYVCFPPTADVQLCRSGADLGARLESSASPYKVSVERIISGGTIARMIENWQERRERH